MIAQQAIGIDMTSGLKGLTLCVNIRLRLPTKDVEETLVVLIALKHLLANSCHEVWCDKR